MDLYKFTGMERTSEGWQDTILETGCSYSCGDFQAYHGEVTEALSKSLFLQPSFLGGSDYSGTLLHVSNHRVFMKRFGKVEGVYEINGGYGTFGVAIRLDVYNSNKEIKEVLDDLDGYPVIDEEDQSELESDADQEYVSNAAKDFVRDQTLESYIPDIDTILEDTDNLEGLIWEATRDLRLEFEHEQHYSFIRNGGKEIQLYVEDRLLIEHCKKLPLLINRNWACDQNEQLYKDKLIGGSNE